jgi:hypothetical protein
MTFCCGGKLAFCSDVFYVFFYNVSGYFPCICSIINLMLVLSAFV